MFGQISSFKDHCNLQLFPKLALGRFVSVCWLPRLFVYTKNINDNKSSRMDMELWKCVENHLRKLLYIENWHLVYNICWYSYIFSGEVKYLGGQGQLQMLSVNGNSLLSVWEYTGFSREESLTACCIESALTSKNAKVSILSLTIKNSDSCM